MNRLFITNNAILMSVLLFGAMFAAIHYARPGCFYKPDGGIREFGVGTRKKTILPMWLVSIILGILSYLAVCYYIIHPKIYL